METKRFLIVISCITFVFCGLMVAYNFATEPPFGSVATLAAAVSADSVPASAASGEDSSFDALFVSAADTTSSETPNPVSSQAQENAASSSAYSAADSQVVTAVSSKSYSVSKKTQAAASKAVSKSVSFPVNINSADAVTLDALPGIGPVLAQRIVDYRTQNGAYHATEDLKNVKGIGDKIFAKLSADVTVG